MGTAINVVAIIVGGAIGLLLGPRLPERVRQTVVAGMGLFTLAYALKQFLTTANALLVLGAILIGALLGEWWQIEAGLARLGEWLERKFSPQTANGAGAPATGSRFVRGFLSASLIFCIGPMAILGAIQDGVTGDYATLAIKSILDGFIALAFASSLGVGVLFSALPILVYQGAITLLAVQVQAVVTPVMMTEMTAAGGVILMGV
ncbi:MAG TPA: DUF554 domain-containing protein, partial [Anaerolineaceae bacterium]|nr:DUF554 domain-containing protein [Anaerolineaceae bacterium]